MASKDPSPQGESTFDYEKFKVKFASTLYKSTVRRLTNYFNLPRAEKDKITANKDPGIALIEHLEAEGLVSEIDVSELLEALRDIGRDRVADELLKSFPTSRHVAKQDRLMHLKTGPAVGELEEGLTKLGVTEPPALANAVLPEKPESVVSLCTDYGWSAVNVIGISHHRIAITGTVSWEEGFLAIVNTEGKILHSNRIPKGKKSDADVYLCGCTFGQGKIALMCSPDQIGIYDTSNRSFTMKSFRSLVSDWCMPHNVYGIAVDPSSSDLYVGSMNFLGISRAMFVFDKNLKYRHTLMIPDSLRGSWPSGFHHGNLLVVDPAAGNVFEVSVEGKSLRVLRTIPKPPRLGSDFSAHRVCSDSKGCIYVLWVTKVKTRGSRVLAQYSPNGDRLLKTVTFDDEVCTMCTVLADSGEKLLILTAPFDKLYTFDISDHRL